MQQPPLTPTTDARWDKHPALDDLFPWTSPGVTGNRRWPYAPSPQILRDRWQALQAELDDEHRTQLFKETGDRSIEKLPITKIEQLSADKPLSRDRGPMTDPVRIGYRAFDRQWILPDIRVLDRPRPDLWQALVPDQFFIVEQHSHAIEDGPGIVFSSVLPDLHHFNNRGGRTLPRLHPNGAPNIAPGLLDALTAALGREVSARDLHAYVAGVVAHPAYTETFRAQLTTPGIRVPITADPALFGRAVALGEQVIWLHTYGQAYTGTERPEGNVRFPRGDERQPLAHSAVTSMPTDVRYDADRQRLILGGGEFGPVTERVWEYTVGGRWVVESWVAYRKADPGGKKSSPLDHIHTDTWDAAWTRELIDLLTVLTRLTDLEEEQSAVLGEVMEGTVLYLSDLAHTGAQWPTSLADRKPDYSAQQLSIDDI